VGKEGDEEGGEKGYNCGLGSQELGRENAGHPDERKEKNDLSKHEKKKKKKGTKRKKKDGKERVCWKGEGR